MDALTQWFIGLFTAQEWRSVAWLIMATLVFTHFVKLTWRLLPIRGGGSHVAIHMIAGVIGLILAIRIWPEGQVPFYIAGPVIGGGGAILTFKLFFPLLSIICAKCAAAFNADRRKTEGGLPPQGLPERRK